MRPHASSDLSDCYGVAWTLLHLIETGPNPVVTIKPAPDANEWHHRLGRGP